MSESPNARAALVCRPPLADLHYCCMSQRPHLLPSIQKQKFAAEAQRQVLPYEPVCAIFRRYLHNHKLRFTPERAMILDAALRKDGLFEPDELVTQQKDVTNRVY